MALAQNARAPATKVLVFRDPLLQEINEIYREDEIIQSINRIRIALDFTKQVVVLSNVPLPGLPISELKDLRDLTGDFLAHRAIKQACQYFLDKFGFVQRKNFIDWSLSTEYSPLPQTLELFEEHGILFSAPKRYARSTITNHFRPIMELLGLSNYRLKFMDQKGHSFLEVWGKDEGSWDERTFGP